MMAERGAEREIPDDDDDLGNIWRSSTVFDYEDKTVSYEHGGLGERGTIYPCFCTYKQQREYVSTRDAGKWEYFGRVILPF